MYNDVLEREPSNIEALVSLAEIYGGTNRNGEAKELIEKVTILRSQLEGSAQRIATRSSVAGQAATSGDNIEPILMQKSRAPVPGKYHRPSAAERADMERKAQALVDDRLGQMRRFEDGMRKGNVAAVSEWLRNATDLVREFSSNTRIFSGNKAKPTDFEVGRDDRTIEERVAQLSSRLLADDLADDDEPARNTKVFRQLSFDAWFDILMETALAQARYRSAEVAYETLRAARNATVFHQDEARNGTIVLVFIACALLAGDVHTANDHVRQYLLNHQFDNNGYRLYGAAFASGVAATEVYHSSQNQKFFLRQVKAIDSVLENRQIVGAARVTAQSKIESLNPNLLLLYAHIMLVGKSYVPSAHYLARAAPLMSDEPLTLLTQGVLHLHRSLQRQTNNRHLQIVQGLSYLLDYRDTRKHVGSVEDQETLYNLGRAFHMLGLSSFAAEYYHRVLDVASVPGAYDLRREASYNLHLIYTMSGNPALARSVIDEHLVI